MEETLSLIVAGLVRESALGRPASFYGYVRFAPNTPQDRVDSATREAIYAARDAGAFFQIDGVALDISDFEIRVGNNFDVNGAGFLIVDSLALTARSTELGSAFSVSVGAASTDRGLFATRALPEAPLLFAPGDGASDFDGSLETAFFVPTLSADLLAGETTYLALAEGRVAEGLTAAEARLVAYLYEAGLDRDGNIDAPGLNFWIDQREAGLTRVELAAAFLESLEFAAAFGPPEMLDDAALVALLYENVLDREPDDAGLAFWRAVAERPGVGAEQLLIAFAESAENVAGSPAVEALYELAPGVWDFLG